MEKMTLNRLQEIADWMHHSGADMDSEPMVVLGNDNYHALRLECLTAIQYHATIETKKEFERFPHFALQIIGAKFFVIPGENARLKPMTSVVRLDNSVVEYIQYREHDSEAVKILLI